MDMFQRIGDILPTFQAYEKMFPSAAYLRNSLSLIYVDILRFCTAAKNVFVDARTPKQKKSKRPNWFSNVTSKYAMPKLIWSSFEDQFGEFIDSFQRHKENIERDANLSHMMAQQKEREAQEIERLKQEQERALALAARQAEESHRRSMFRYMVVE